MEDSGKIGSVVCVGTGMTVGAHITPIARSHVKVLILFICSTFFAEVVVQRNELKPTFIASVLR
jgi:ribose 5-phosphate isomerase